MTIFLVERVQDIVAEAVSAVLDINGVSDDLCLWDVGVQSLDLIKIAALIGERTGVFLPLSETLERPSIAALQQGLERAVKAHDLAIGHLADDPELPRQENSLSQICLLRQKLDAKDNAGNCPLLWIMHGAAEVPRLREALRLVVREHDALRRRYSLAGSTLIAAADAGALWNPLAITARSVDEALLMARAELRRPLSPEIGEVIRAVIATVADDPMALVLGVVVHHVGFDGSSEALLAKALQDAYRRLGPKATISSVGPSAHTFRYGMEEPDVGAAEAAFRSALLPMVGDVNRRRLQSPEVATTVSAPAERIVRPVPEAEALRKLARECSVSYACLMTGVYARTLCELSDSSTSCVAIPVSLRDAAGRIGRIGNETVLLPIVLPRTSASAGAIGSDTSRCILRAFAYRHLAIERMIRIAVREGVVSTTLFEHVFAYQGTAEPGLTFPGIISKFLRDPYYTIPNATICEIWPLANETNGNGDSIALHYDPLRVTAEGAAAILDNYVAGLHVTLGVASSTTARQA